MSDQEPGPTHTPYGQPPQGDPYGQPQYGQAQYGQPQYGQPQYGQAQYGKPAGDRRPGTVTAAAWITIVFSAITAAIFGFTTLALIVARDQVITEMERVPEFQDANIDADAAVGVLVAVMLGFLVWTVVAIVLAVLVLRRSNVARILLVISASVAALLSLLTITSGVTLVVLIAAVATIVMLFAGGASAWFKGLSADGGGYGGYQQQYPGQHGAPTPYGETYGQAPSASQPSAAPSYPSSENPYGQPGSSGQYPPPPSENPYGQPPAEGQDGSEHPPKEYPGR